MSNSERNQEKVRKLSLLPENKECMDCQMRSTPYVVMDYCTFVCSFCSGIHRHFQHRVKGISMTNFKPEEVNKLTQGGNQKALQKWRASWKQSQYPKPKANQEAQIKKFIRLTYEKKQWYSDTPNNDDDQLPEVRPINEIIDEPIQIKVDRSSAPQKKSTAATSGFGDDDDWDADFDDATPQKPKQNDLNAFFGDDDAPVHQGNSNTNSTHQNTDAIPKANIDLDSLFGPSASTTGNAFPPQNAYGGSQPYGGNYPPPQQHQAFGGGSHEQYNGAYGVPQNTYGGPQQQYPPQQSFGGAYGQHYPQQQQGYGGYGLQYPQQTYGGYPQQQYPPQTNGNNYGTPQNQSGPNPFGGRPRSDSNPFGGNGTDSNPFDTGIQSSGRNPAQQQVKKQEPQKPDPFQSLTSLGKSSLSKSTTPQSGGQSNGGGGSNGFGDDDFPF
eukprot:CAMPEP_0117451434 /NCGR_PEP_ID=MMETSP0759-20121206/9003_1 /TAXON_ID=63605 /ORGANISM="Percolomonas cosmopolitus, Strain WS" /LENGTH=438 /DNA_ID=CAMNT_0005244029 /DNA_START=103 /DNA_END=1419 /DNA_ORIENTATION=-